MKASPTLLAAREITSTIPSNLAFDKRIAMTNDLVVVEATAVSALPKNQQIFGSPKINFKL